MAFTKRLILFAIMSMVVSIKGKISSENLFCFILFHYKFKDFLFSPFLINFSNFYLSKIILMQKRDVKRIQSYQEVNKLTEQTVILKK